MARGRRNRNSSDEDLPKAKVTRENLREALLIFRYVKPYQGRFILGLFFIALSSATTMAFPYGIKLLIDWAMEIKDGARINNLDTAALALIGVLSLQMVFSYFRIYLFAQVGERALGDLRKEVYSQLIRMPMTFFSQRRVGELSNRLSADLSQIQNTLTFVLVEFLRGILTLVIGMLLITYLSYQLALVMLSVVPLVVVIAVVFGFRIRKLSRKAQDQLAESGTVVQETLQAIANVKAFANEWFEMKRYGRSIDETIKLSLLNAKYRGVFISFLLFSVFGAIVLVVWYGAGMMLEGELSFGDLTAFVVYTAFVGGSMAGFADVYSQLQKTIGATQRVREILRDDTETVAEKAVVVAPEHKIQGHVNFTNVGFAYPSRAEVTVLQDISFAVHPGEQVALVGSSGSGKSTLVSLLLRFYQPNQGTITFDDRASEDYPLSQLRAQMAMVPQDVILFGGTIRENIKYGHPDATDEQMEAAAVKAHAHEFITSFPEGYDTIVGERGIKLSGGQRQRVAIARAILRDPAILILDEATSSLDSESEQVVQKALDNVMEGRTTFVVAHRLSTIRNADKILVLDQGRIVETGTHQELIDKPGGVYQKLSELQFQTSSAPH